MVADLGAMIVELAPRHVATLDRERDGRIEFPFGADAGPHFLVCQPGVVQTCVAVAVAKAVVGSKSVSLDVGPGEKSKITVRLILKPRRRHGRIQHPFRSELPANATAEEGRNSALQIHTDAED